MRRVIFDEPGKPDVLRLVQDQLAAPEANEVQIEVRLIGLNRFETQFRRDSYAISPVLPSPIGAEGVGLIRDVGREVTGFERGDRVTVLPISPAVGTGMYADFANVPVSSLVRSLEASTDEQEAAFWCAYLTAYMLLTETPLPTGSQVLVTAAASSVGLALLQMVRDMGCHSIATTRSRSKVDALRALGADHVIVTDEENIAQAVTEATDGKGVAIAADALAGRFLIDVVASTSEGGAVRIYGALSEPSMRGTHIDLPMFALYRKTVSFVSIYSVMANPGRFELAQAYLRDGFARGAFRPQTDRTFALDEIVEAHRYLEGGNQIGKVLCRPNP